MTKKKKVTVNATQQRPNRTGKSHNFYLNADLTEALDAYVEAADPGTNNTAVVRSALKKYLAERGYWPWPRPQTPHP